MSSHYFSKAELLELLNASNATLLAESGYALGVVMALAVERLPKARRADFLADCRERLGLTDEETP